VKKKRTRFSVLVGLVVFLLAASLMTGCHQKANPDVTDTPVGGAQIEQREEITPDFQATALANATRAAQVEITPTEEDGEEPSPTSPLPTPTPPPPTETSVATTAVPTFTPQPAEEVVATTVPVTSETGKHTVQAGENMFRIALRYGTSVQAIANANGITNPALIYVGQVLTIPSAGAPAPAPGRTTYVVRPGDNLFRIALKYNMSYTYLAQYNNIANPSTIYVGQVLRIP